MPTPNIEVVIDCANPQELAAFWREALNYEQIWTAEDLVVLVPAEGTNAKVLLQRVPEAKVAKNRVHIDLIADAVDAEVARLEACGARRAHDGVQTYGPTQWVVMSDPEGNEFCVSTGVPS